MQNHFLVAFRAFNQHLNVTGVVALMAPPHGWAFADNQFISERCIFLAARPKWIIVHGGRRTKILHLADYRPPAKWIFLVFGEARCEKLGVTGLCAPSAQNCLRSEKSI